MRTKISMSKRCAASKLDDFDAPFSDTLRARSRNILRCGVGDGELVKAHFLWRPQLQDPGDEMVLETAVKAQADALVTFNVRDFGSVPERFGIEVMIPREAIRRVRR